MLAIERLEEELSNAIGAWRFHTSPTLPAILSAAVKRSEGSTGVPELFSLFSDAIDEVNSCTFRREDRKETYSRALGRIRDQFFEALASGDADKQHGWLFAAHSQIQLISVAVTERTDVDTAALDRVGFVAKTQELIDEVKDWSMDEYAKRSLVLSLSMICQQASAEGSSYSDHEVRRRIKSIIASFALEFTAIDREYETRLEKLRRWATFGFRGSAVPLGLTADASEVVGLLPKP